jgi:hypothetical protein
MLQPLMRSLPTRKAQLRQLITEEALPLARQGQNGRCKACVQLQAIEDDLRNFFYSEECLETAELVGCLCEAII